MKMNLKKGFTLIELLVVVAIIAILAAVIMAALNNARSKGVDGAIKANLANAMKQAEVYYNTNTTSPDSYSGGAAGVCTNGTQGGALGVGAQITAAARAKGISTTPAYTTGGGGSTSLAYCNFSSSGWAAQVPLSATGQMWCVDSLGYSKQTSTALASSADIICN